MSPPSTPPFPPSATPHEPDSPHPQADPFDTPLFRRLLDLIEEKMEKQDQRLANHGEKLDALVKDAQRGQCLLRCAILY